jgi:hypothetical protein
MNRSARKIMMIMLLLLSVTIVYHPAYPLNLEETVTKAPDAVTAATRLCPLTYIWSHEDPRLDTIRQFRDEVLTKSPVGMKLIELYYRNYEIINEILEQNPEIKESAKNILDAILPAIEFLLQKYHQ